MNKQDQKQFRNGIKGTARVATAVSIANFLLTKEGTRAATGHSTIEVGLWRWNGGRLERESAVKVPVPTNFSVPDWNAFASTQGLRQGQNLMSAPRNAVCIWPNGEEPVRTRFVERRYAGLVALQEHLSSKEVLIREEEEVLQVLQALPRLGDKNYEPRGALLEHLKPQDAMDRPSNHRFFNLPIPLRVGGTVMRLEFNARPEKVGDSKDRDVIRWMAQQGGGHFEEKKRWITSVWEWQPERGYTPVFTGWTNLPFMVLSGQVAQVFRGSGAVEGGQAEYYGVLDGQPVLLPQNLLLQEGRDAMEPIMSTLRAAAKAKIQRSDDARAAATGLLTGIEL